MIFTIDEARKYLVQYHLINTNQQVSIQDVFDRIKSIQYDPLNVVGTNPELVLQSRIKGFQKEMLYNALYKSRTLIDGWDKQMCIYQSEYVPHFNLVRKQRALSEIATGTYLELEFKHLVNEVYKLISENGPMLSSEIQMGDTKKHSWGPKKASSIALNYLFHNGDIGVDSRKNTQRKFDVFQNLYPNVSTANPFLSKEAFIEFHLLRRIQALGLVWNKNSVAFSGLHINKKKIRSTYLDVLLRKKQIQEITIIGLKDTFYIPTNILNKLNRLSDDISIIAPLDNLLWDRALIKELFGFDYKWEVYVPKDKRKYGYYVLPLLKGNRFIGRVSFEQQRNTEALVIQQVYLEANISYTKVLEKELGICFKDFASYLNAKSVEPWNENIVKSDKGV